MHECIGTAISLALQEREAGSQEDVLCDLFEDILRVCDIFERQYTLFAITSDFQSLKWQAFISFGWLLLDKVSHFVRYIFL